MIERFRTACCYPTLPEVFGEEFSYYEEICAIITKLNEVISAVNNFNGVTKEYVDKHVGNHIITVNNVNDSLTLTTNKTQYTTLTIPVEVILPTVTEYTEIHLFFNGLEGAELNTTNVKWESQLTIENNKSYEVVFTYVNDVIGWLAKSIIYN